MLATMRWRNLNNKDEKKQKITPPLKKTFIVMYGKIKVFF